MKLRAGFVTNSSSSSFITLSVGDKIIDQFDDYNSYDINDFIDMLVNASNEGHSRFCIDGVASCDR